MILIISAVAIGLSVHYTSIKRNTNVNIRDRDAYGESANIFLGEMRIVAIDSVLLFCGGRFVEAIYSRY